MRWRSTGSATSRSPSRTSPAPARTLVAFDQVDIDRATAYAAEDADVTLRLWQVLKPRLAAEGLVSRLRAAGAAAGAGAGAHGAARHLGRPADPVAALRRARAGRGARSRTRSTARRRALQHRLAEAARRHPVRHAWACPAARKTKTGQWSTSAQVLEELAAEGHELPRKIVDWRQLTKLKSTYTDALPGYIHPETRRVHTSYALAATTTGRLSSSDPNLQNIPVRTEEGRKIRTAFIADTGNKLVSADYSQIELRVLAHIADIPQLQAGLRRRPRHPRHDRVGDVRRAGRGHAVARCAAAPRRSISASSTASRPSAWPTSCRSRARRPATTSSSYFERFPGIRDYMDGDQGLRARARLCRDDLRPPHRTIPRSARPTRRSAPSTSAPRSTRRSRARPPTSSAAP